MTTSSETSIPFRFTVGDQTLIEGRIFPGRYAAALAAPTVPASTRSYPITPAQAQEITRKVDSRTVDLLRAIALGEGELAYGEMKRILGINVWKDFTTRYGRGLNRTLRHETKNSSAFLIWWLDEEWNEDEDADAHVYVDGVALKSLRIAFGLEAA